MQSATCTLDLNCSAPGDDGYVVVLLERVAIKLEAVWAGFAEVEDPFANYPRCTRLRPHSQATAALLDDPATLVWVGDHEFVQHRADHVRVVADGLRVELVDAFLLREGLQQFVKNHQQLQKKVHGSEKEGGFFSARWISVDQHAIFTRADPALTCLAPTSAIGVGSKGIVATFKVA